MNKTIKRMAAQGDLLFVRIKSIPTNVQKLPSNGRLIVGHSETGHHHLVKTREGSKDIDIFIDPDNSSTRYVASESRMTIAHDKSFDRHEDIDLDPGIWEVRQQREWAPEGMKKVVD